MRGNGRGKRNRIAAGLALALALSAVLVSGCGRSAETAETAASSDSEVLIGPGGHTINREEAQEIWEKFGEGGINHATEEADSNEVEARIRADAYMRYYANGISKSYDAIAYAGLFSMDFRKWYEEYFSAPIEDIVMDMEPLFTEVGEYKMEELDDPQEVYSSENIDEFITELSGEDINRLSDPWKDLRKMMNGWTVKHAFHFTFRTTLRDGNKPCEVEFLVLNVGTGWGIDVRNLQGPLITES